MPTSQYLAFGTGTGANTLTPASYAASPLLPIGHQPGVALSEVANTTWRQTSVAASAIAQMVTDLTSLDMLDDGSVTNYKVGVISAIQRLVRDQQFWSPGDIKGTLASGAVPSGWLPADGRLVSRSLYASLFAAIGTTYGAGDGSTNFALPDLRGEFLRGWDDGRGVDASRGLGTPQGWTTGRPKTTNPVRITDAGVGLLPLQDGSGTGSITGSPGQIGFGRATKSGQNNTSDATDASGAGIQIDVVNLVDGDPETRPRNVAVRWLIKI